jgi:snRNA-activating protein complex subunit 3
MLEEEEEEQDEFCVEEKDELITFNKDIEEEIINVKSFLKKRVELVHEDYFKRNKNVIENIQNDMNHFSDNKEQNDAFIKELEKNCHPEHLNEMNEDDLINEADDLDSEHLSIIDFVKQNYTKSTKRVQPLEVKFMKNLAKLNEMIPTSEMDTIKTPDVIITVQITQHLNSRKLSWSEDILVLGETLLSDLKDKITCFRDEVRIGEMSAHPDELLNKPKLKDIVKSGYFFIENTFYNDYRNGNNDCSNEPIEWAQKIKFGNLLKRDMNETKFIDLNFRIDFPYLYCHLGNCEHLILFTSIKLVNPATDCYVLSQYPILKDKTRGRFTFCWLCNKLYAKWIVCNSQFAVDDPTFLCDRCFRNTHYSIEITDDSTKQYTKLFDFKAYHLSQL